ncbi:MAG: RusA family crossover junction endodeoxyribonuclease [Patescibacteria group bacterium]|nr:RusA family crossover junction endodeoxyribonuclease [Patescibacteria group bacterium]
MFQTDLPDSGFKPIRFTLPYMPRPKLESKSRAIPLKNKKTGQPILDKTGKPMYTNMQYKNPEQKQYEQEVMALITRHAPVVPFDCAVILTLKIYVPMPNSIYDSWRREPAEQGFIRPDKKPDLSNFTKGIEDLMTRAGFWRDDGQIVEYGHGYAKHYSVKPRVEVEVTPLWQPQSKKEWELFQKRVQEQRPKVSFPTDAPPDYTATSKQGDLFS